MPPDRLSSTVFVRILTDNDLARTHGLTDQAKVGVLRSSSKKLHNAITQLSYTANLIANMGPHWKVEAETGKVEYILS